MTGTTDIEVLDVLPGQQPEEPVEPQMVKCRRTCEITMCQDSKYVD